MIGSSDSELDVQWCRRQFPGLAHVGGNGRPAAFFDGPAGTQVPQRVIDEISRYLAECIANRGGQFDTSRQTDEWMQRVHTAVADFLGTDDWQTVCFGPNMTTLTLHVSRALARTWQPGDEIVVSRSEHDANFTPWVLAAEDAGVDVRFIDIDPTDCTLDLTSLRNVLSDRTRLVAVGHASNATGTRHPVAEICRLARQFGALTFVDAVHIAPHDLIDVHDIGCDFLVCSAYKFFGPHQGILWARREILESVRPYKLRPAPDQLPGRWMSGTQNHACLAGTMAAVDYLAEIGRQVSQRNDLNRRQALVAAFESIVAYEGRLIQKLIRALQEIPAVKVWGITDPNRLTERVPTVCWTHESRSSREIAQSLGQQGFFVWHGNYYAQPLTERLGLEPDGMVRVGVVHYNTEQEIDDLIGTLRQLLG